ncbi:alpha/beta hydrolase [Dactylosporangium siamense]|uniref:alpha/beta hydrolase n=1 Tax=Dactylosporangium siamense TaxID=685454 RepID=UPI001EF32045|nr:alpha/beta hydrolase [Dactylosporangium siamense]
MQRPAYLAPLVVPVDPVEPERGDTEDVYLPDAGAGRRPAVVLVHGGPVPAGRRPTPRDWPVYRGYGSLLAGRGVVAVTVDHPLHSLDDYPRSAALLHEAVERAREHPRVDGDRIALWCFSGGGPLCAGWLRDPPSWLRCVALTYPWLGSSVLEPSFRPVGAVEAVGAAAATGVAGAMRANALPIVLTRVGLERPDIAATVAEFVAAARTAEADLTIIDVPAGQHGFDTLDDTDASRHAVTQAVDRVLATLR